MNVWLVRGLAFGVSAAIAGMVAGAVRRRRDAGALREQVQVWEGEGGQVPGATLGAPAAKPAADQQKSHSAST
jgi:hypothetical protein